MSAVDPLADSVLYAMAAALGRALLAARWRIATAESCTGGWIAKALTDIPGSSQWVECGFVTYSNTAKIRSLGVSARTLERDGAVSEATVREMASGALRVSEAQVSIAVSGIAGPDGGTPQKPLGTVWFAVAGPWAEGGGVHCERCCFEGDRERVRRGAVGHGLALVLTRVRRATGVTVP